MSYMLKSALKIWHRRDVLCAHQFVHVSLYSVFGESHSADVESPLVVMLPST